MKNLYLLLILTTLNLGCGKGNFVINEPIEPPVVEQPSVVGVWRMLNFDTFVYDSTNIIFYEFYEGGVFTYRQYLNHFMFEGDEYTDTIVENSAWYRVENIIYFNYLHEVAQCKIQYIDSTSLVLACKEEYHVMKFKRQ